MMANLADFETSPNHVLLPLTDALRLLRTLESLRVERDGYKEMVSNLRRRPAGSEAAEEHY